MLLTYFNRKEYLRHRAVSLRQHGFLVLFTVNVIRQMVPLFSKVDSNSLWHDVQHEENVISAQFGKDLFNTSKVIGRKKVAQFFDSQCSLR